MRQKDIIALIFALGIAVLSTLLARVLFQAPVTPTNQEQEKTTNDATKEMIEVLVATDTLVLGSTITTRHITWQRWPKNSVLEAYIVRNDSDEDQYQKIIGSLLRRTINVGEPITVNDIIKKGDHSFLSAIVRPGMRAISLPLGTNSAGSALLSPGDTVDVIAAIHAQGVQATNEILSGKTLAESVRILAIDQRLDDQKSTPTNQDQPKFITLEVTPTQAEILAMALKLGELTYSLRGIQAEEEAKPKVEEQHQTDQEKLKAQLKQEIEQRQKAAQKPEKPAPRTVRVIRGDIRTQLTFRETGVEEITESRGTGTTSASAPGNGQGGSR
jgi:pilus assembly protein CpaB